MLKLIDPYPPTTDAGDGRHSQSYNNFFHHSNLLAQQHDPNAQQSMNTKSPMSVLLQQKEKIKKIMKFEQMMKRLCREVGIDKKTLFTMFLGESAPQRHELESGSKEM